MKRGQFTTIVVNGESLRAEYLGKGHFSTGYRVDDSVYLFTIDDPIKECHCHIEGVNLPEIVHIESIDRRGVDVEVYRMKYYRNITAADSSAWSNFKRLSELLEEARTEIWAEIKGFSYKRHNCYLMQRFADKVQDSDLSDEIKDSINNLYSWAINYGSGVGVEMGKRNIGVDESGNIILRDCLYDADRLRW